MNPLKPLAPVESSAAVPVEERTAEMEQLMERLRERACDYRDMARVERDADCWNAAYGSDGKASGLFLALRMIRDHIEGKAKESIQEVKE